MRKVFNNNSNRKFTFREILEMERDNANASEGEHGEELWCDECKNKGLIYFIDEKDMIVKWRPCSCDPARKTIRRLNASGISNEMLQRLSFATFNTEKPFQKYMLDTSKSYVYDIENGAKNWLLVSGQSGCGKTHICTAVFQDIIRRGHKGEYLDWCNWSTKMAALSNSYHQEDYESEFDRVVNIDVLYIDDFLKLANARNKDSVLEIAYKLINARQRENKITIISSEYSINDMAEFDSATRGRIAQACTPKYVITIGRQLDRDYRTGAGMSV